jgi:hypothetical protein
VGHEAEGAPRQGHHSPDYPNEDGFLVEGGWHIENAGSTGEPIGRRSKGARQPDAIQHQLLRTAHEFEDLLKLHLLQTRALSNKAHWRELSALLIALSGDRLNDAATAESLGFSRKTFDNRDKRGRETFSGLIENVVNVVLHKTPLRGEGRI